jgi:YidC/Oxa1 family membrane protein insertase
MDKQSILLGVLFLGGGLALMSYNGMLESAARKEALEREISANERALQTAAADEPAPFTPVAIPNLSAGEITAAGVQPLPVPPSGERPDEERPLLENGSLRVTLSSYGGAVRTIELLQFSEENPRRVPDSGPVVLNAVADVQALTLAREAGTQLLPLATVYRVESATRERVVFRADLAGGMVVRRTYTIADGNGGPEPYTLRHRTEFYNPTDSAQLLDKVFLNVGTAAPSAADHMGFNLNASYRDNGSYDSIAASKFRGGGFIFKSEPKERIREPGIIQWGAVKNQFFTTILTPTRPADALVASGVRFPANPRSGEVPIGITAALEFGLPTIAPQETHVIEADFYAGPKELRRLSRIGQGQEDVMQLGWFLGMFLGLISFIAKALLSLMAWIHGLIGNWGFAIIGITFIIRLLLWPLTAKAARASKRMQKLSKPMQEMREKHKDNPQKLNEEMLAFWKKHKINPMSGCWPVLLQFPIFIAFFNMLRNATELRFAPFLWIGDLSMPDASISFGDTFVPFLGNSLNLLPFVWLASMYFQMKMMPQPSIDNAQIKIIKWMPFIFFPFTYYFSSGLVLYWTTTNLFSIGQQWITNRVKDEEDTAIEQELAEREQTKRGAPTGPLIRKKKKRKEG